MNEASCQTQGCTRQDPCSHVKKLMLFEEIYPQLLRYKLHNSREFIHMEHSTEALEMTPKLCYESQEVVHAKRCKQWGTEGRSGGETSPHSWHLSLTEKMMGLVVVARRWVQKTLKSKPRPTPTSNYHSISMLTPFPSKPPQRLMYRCFLQCLTSTHFQPLPAHSPPPHTTATALLRPLVTSVCSITCTLSGVSHLPALQQSDQLTPLPF